MEQIIKACQSGEIPMDVVCVISSNPDAGGLEKAKRLGISKEDILIISPEQEDFGVRILAELRARGVTVVTQNGWLPLTPEVVINEYPRAIFNQHPGPVPEFGGKGMYGRRVHAARLLFVRITKRDYWTKAIAQRVAKEYDQGVVLKSTRVEILPEDTVDDLQQRVLPAEHRLQVELLKDFAQGSLQEITTREVLVRPGEEGTLSSVKRTARLLYPHG